MKQFLIALLLLLCITVAIGAQPADLVVLLDVSESVFSIFPNITSYLLTDAMDRFIEFGDTFHLILFSDKPHTEIVKKIENREDVEAVIEGLLVTYPLGKYTDLIRALFFLDSYIEDSLAVNSIKRVIILTDGIHDPPPDSPYTGAEVDVSEKARDVGRRLQEKNLDLRIQKVAPDEKQQEAGSEPKDDRKQNGEEGGEQIIEDIREGTEAPVYEFDTEDFDAYKSEDKKTEKTEDDTDTQTDREILEGGKPASEVSEKDSDESRSLSTPKSPTQSGEEKEPGTEESLSVSEREKNGRDKKIRDKDEGKRSVQDDQTLDKPYRKRTDKDKQEEEKIDTIWMAIFIGLGVLIAVFFLLKNRVSLSMINVDRKSTRLNSSHYS